MTTANQSATTESSPLSSTPGGGQLKIDAQFDDAPAPQTGRAAEELSTPISETPSSLYVNPRGLYDFQAEQLSYGYLQLLGGLSGLLVVWDMGTGKGHFAMRLSTLMREDDLIDLTIIAAEKNKLSEWKADFERFTLLRPHIYHGPKRLEKLGDEMPDVLITTFETGRTDLAKKSGKALVDGPLLPLVRGKRCLVVFDESTKLKNRSSWNYKAWERTLVRLRNAYKGTKAIGMTGTPIETGWEDAYSQIRLIAPKEVLPVGEWQDAFVRSRDIYDRPNYHKDRMHLFAESVEHLILRKRKTDPDVVEQFPELTEESRWIEMGPEQDRLYRLVQDLGRDEEGDWYDPPTPGLAMLLRQVAAHPGSVVLSARKPDGSRLAKMLVEELGADAFLGCPSAKTIALVDYLVPLVAGQGAKAVCFTFFGQSVLPLLQEALEQAGLKVYPHHGGQTEREQERVKTAFRSDPEPCVFLTSDAGARGINLPEASYVVEYERALTYATRMQRINRVHRIGSGGARVTAMTFLVPGTVEKSIFESVMRRNEQHDQLLGDDVDPGEAHWSAADRKAALMEGARKRRR